MIQVLQSHAHLDQADAPSFKEMSFVFRNVLLHYEVCSYRGVSGFTFGEPVQVSVCHADLPARFSHILKHTDLKTNKSQQQSTKTATVCPFDSILGGDLIILFISFY